MKNLLIAIVFSFMLAVQSVDSGAIAYRKPIPIVYSMTNIPQYSRKKLLRKHFLTDFIV